MSFNKKLKVCLVGNSGEIIGSKLGKKIDQCDEVVRFNDFLIDGFEEDAGTKTTVVCLNFQEGAMLPNVRKFPNYPTRKMAEKCKIWCARPMDIHRHQRCVGWLGHANVVQPTPEQWNRALENAYIGFWRQQPSTGLAGIEMARDIFKDYEIYLCGFDFNPKEKDHYFDDIKEIDDPTQPHNGHGHNWPGEIQYIKRLIEKKEIHLL